MSEGIASSLVCVKCEDVTSPHEAAGTPGQAERTALETTFRRTYALHPNDFRTKFEQARDAVMGAADAYAQAVAQADLLSRLRTVLLDLRTQPVEARIQALHLLDAAASPPAVMQSAPDDAPFWEWLDSYVDEPHQNTYEVPDMQRAFEAGQEAAMAARQPQPAPELAAYEADIASLTGQRNRVSETADQLRAVVAEMLDSFGPSGSGHTARVGQVQIAKWRTRSGLTP